jgi:hypothetical protein
VRVWPGPDGKDDPPPPIPWHPLAHLTNLANGTIFFDGRQLTIWVKPHHVGTMAEEYVDDIGYATPSKL